MMKKYLKTIMNKNRNKKLGYVKGKKQLCTIMKLFQNLLILDKKNN